MAGVYPDAPSRRLAHDADGTVVATANNGSGKVLVEFNSVTINDENQDTYLNLIGSGVNEDDPQTVWFLWPEKREIDGFYVFKDDPPNGRDNPTWNHYYSNDTTAGLDGTWASGGSSQARDTGAELIPDYRNKITSSAVTGATGTKLVGVEWIPNSYIAAMHIYGTISPGETPDRMLYLDTENSDAEFSKVLDYGDVPRGQTQQRTIKIKNNSATKTINTLQLTAEDLYLNAGQWYTFSLDDVAYQATLNTIGNMGPGATQLIYVKQSVPDAEQIGPQVGRLRLTHASLT